MEHTKTELLRRLQVTGNVALYHDLDILGAVVDGMRAQIVNSP